MDFELVIVDILNHQQAIVCVALYVGLNFRNLPCIYMEFSNSSLHFRNSSHSFKVFLFTFHR